MPEPEVEGWFEDVNIHRLPLTYTYDVPGQAGLKNWPELGLRPACSEHQDWPMFRPSPDGSLYICSTCNIHCEWHPGMCQEISEWRRA